MTNRRTSCSSRGSSAAATTQTPAGVSASNAIAVETRDEIMEGKGADVASGDGGGTNACVRMEPRPPPTLPRGRRQSTSTNAETQEGAPQRQSVRVKRQVKKQQQQQQQKQQLEGNDNGVPQAKRPSHSLAPPPPPRSKKGKKNEEKRNTGKTSRSASQTAAGAQRASSVRAALSRRVAVYSRTNSVAARQRSTSARRCHSQKPQPNTTAASGGGTHPLRKLRESGAAVINDAPLTSFLEPFTVGPETVVSVWHRDKSVLLCQSSAASRSSSRRSSQDGRSPSKETAMQRHVPRPPSDAAHGGSGREFVLQLLLDDDEDHEEEVGLNSTRRTFVETTPNRPLSAASAAVTQISSPQIQAHAQDGSPQQRDPVSHSTLSIGSTTKILEPLTLPPSTVAPLVAPPEVAAMVPAVCSTHEGVNAASTVHSRTSSGSQTPRGASAKTRLLQRTGTFFSAAPAMMAPKWKCFSTMTALLIALADAGCLDQRLPVESIQFVHFPQFLRSHPSLTKELKSADVLPASIAPLVAAAQVVRVPEPPGTTSASNKGTAAAGRRASRRVSASKDSAAAAAAAAPLEELIPVAVLEALPVKGKTVALSRSLPTLRRRSLRTRSVSQAPSLKSIANARGAPGAVASTLAPFSDAEVFQLLYLQLLLRAAYDVRLRGFITTASADSGASAGGASTRLCGEKIGYRVSGRQGVAFEHPLDNGRWVVFPPNTRLLSLMNLHEWVIPLYATRQALRQTSKQRLIAAVPSTPVPCVSSFGRRVLSEWAAKKVIDSPATAYDALVELFNLFGDAYAAKRSAVLHAPVAPYTFRCSESLALRRLRERNGDLSRFFTSVVERGANAAKAQAGEVVPQNAATPAASHFPAFSVLDAAAHLPHVVDSDSSSSSSPSPSRAPSAAQLRRGTAANVPDGTLSVGTPSINVTSPPLDTRKETTSVNSPVPPLQLVPAGDGKLAEALDEELESESQSITSETPHMDVQAVSPFTKQESLVTRWRQYIQVGLVSLFNGTTDGMEVTGLLGRGGSGLVYRGLYGRSKLPVAVKCFVRRDGMTHETYVRESLTDVAFLVLFNQLADHGILYGARAHDFIVCSTPPAGMPAEDIALCSNAAKLPVKEGEAPTQLCFLVTDIMDGTLGRFLTEEDDDFDPMYDALINSPLNDGEMFQFLFVQLVIRALFNYTVHDVMLNGQLRGDNIGYRVVSQVSSDLLWFDGAHSLPFFSTEVPHAVDDGGATQGYVAERGSRVVSTPSYEGIIIEYQTASDDTCQYLRFPADNEKALRFICFIDLGQGMQPYVQKLTESNLIGSTVVDSCVEDDGMGRYWPSNELYCKYIDVAGGTAREAQAWGTEKRISTAQEAELALRELLELYQKDYGMPQPPTPGELTTHAVYSWTTRAMERLKSVYVYR